jgi:hypothetical protein
MPAKEFELDALHGDCPHGTHEVKVGLWAAR